MINCHKATELSSLSMDQPLTYRQKMALRLHNFMCKNCKCFDQQMHSLRDICRVYSERRDDKHDDAE